jgi:WD40 repeat protein
MAASCWFGECTDLAIDVFEGGGLGRPSATYTGFDAPAAGLAFSPDGEVLAAIAPVSVVDPVDNVAVWRVGQPDRPERLFSISDTGLDIRATPGDLPPGWVVFSPDGRRLYASGAGPIVEFDVTSGEVLGSIEGLGGLALSDDGSTLAVLQEGNVVELVDTSTGLARLALNGHDALITAAAFSDDGARVATTSIDETVIVWDVETGERVHVLEGHSGSVLNVAFSPDGSMLFSSAADRSLFLWDVAGSSGLARPLTESTLDVASESSVILSPTGDSITIAALAVYIVELDSNAVTELTTGPDEVAWAAYSPNGRHVATVAWDGATMLFDVGDRSGTPVASRPGRGVDNFGAVAFTADGAGVLVADAGGMVVELDGETLDPTGRSIDVGVEANGVRTAPGGRFAVTSSPPDPAGGTDIVFGDLDGGRILRTVHIDSWGPRANFNADGSRYAAGGEDGRLSVIDVATGTVTGPRDPVHSGPISWVTFSPDGKTLASMGFDGDLILSDAATAIPYAHVQPGPANTRGGVSYHPDGHTVLVGYQDGLVIAYETESEAWITEACRIAGRNLNQDEWRDAFGDESYRATCPVSD